ncbi:hypothetical protein ACWDGI_28725 [Streptomyces sp. NPDC001220]
MPTPRQQAERAGGAYTVEHSPWAASFLNLPLASPDSFTTSPVAWGPSS